MGWHIASIFSLFYFQYFNIGLLLITLEITGQKEMATNCARVDVHWMLIKISLLKGWSSIERGCSGK